MWLLLLLVLLGLFILSNTYFEIRDDIEIAASPEKVWAAVIAFDKYDQWNSQLSYLGGTVGPGGQLQLKLSADGATPYTFQPKVSAWVPQKQFAWLAVTGLPKIFDGEHFFELKDLGNGKTLVTNREKYSGILSQLMRRLPMMKTAPAGFKKMNLELKNYIESI